MYMSMHIYVRMLRMSKHALLFSSEFLNTFIHVHTYVCLHTAGNIDGDPMFTVPLSINKKMLSQFSKKDKQWDLCYEVHGREDKIYNLVSDQCVLVNTHLKLASNPKVGNIMARIGIVAKDYDGRCHKIQADLEGKKVTINDMQMKNRTWMGRGITVIKLGDKVRVSVPNCKGQKMVFWIVFHFMNGADMIKFIIADGNGLSPSSHGLMGKSKECRYMLWNGFILHIRNIGMYHMYVRTHV